MPGRWPGSTWETSQTGLHAHGPASRLAVGVTQGTAPPYLQWRVPVVVRHRNLTEKTNYQVSEGGNAQARHWQQGASIVPENGNLRRRKTARLRRRRCSDALTGLNDTAGPIDPRSLRRRSGGGALALCLHDFRSWSCFDRRRRRASGPFQLMFSDRLSVRTAGS